MASTPDLSEFHKLSRPRKPPCKVGVAAQQLESDEERAQLQAACDVDSGIITHGAIEKWLSARGQAVSSSAINSHRKRTCTCAAAA